MGDDDGAKLEDVQRALGALVFDAGVERLLAADDDDLPMSQLRARMLAEPLRPPPPSQAQLFGEQMVTILRDGLRQQLIDGASGKLGQHRAPRTCNATHAHPAPRRGRARVPAPPACVGCDIYGC